jgi:hypothetical protein
MQIIASRRSNQWAQREPIDSIRPMKVRSLEPPTKQSNRPNGHATRLEVLLISIYIGTLAVCGLMIFVLLIQIKELNMGIAQRDWTITALLDRERQTVQRVVAKVPILTEERRPVSTSFTLSNADVTVIRHFIKVRAPEPGGAPKIHLGDKISNAALASLPEPLIDQIPRLQGAKFLIDQNGALVIVNERTKRAEAVIASE